MCILIRHPKHAAVGPRVSLRDTEGHRTVAPGSPKGLGNANRPI